MNYEKAYNDLCKLISHLDNVAMNEMIAVQMMSDCMYDGVADVKFANASGRMDLTNQLKQYIRHQMETE